MNRDNITVTDQETGEVVRFGGNESEISVNGNIVVTKTITNLTPTKIVQYKDAFRNVKVAVKKSISYFKRNGNKRGKVIMPCGAGKTLFSCFLIMKLQPKRVIVTVPNLLLEEQSFRVFHTHLFNEGYEFICIGSDKDIAQGLGHIIQVTTSEDEIKEFLVKNKNKKIIMLATYQSMGVVCSSCQFLHFKFNLGIADEAHRTVGEEEKMFAKILFNKNIRIDKRLFMTATEKVYNGAKDEIIGMNNEDNYGKTIYDYSLSDAIEKDKILCDYEINEMYSSDDDVFEFVKSNSYLDYENINLTDKEKQGLLCALLATIQAIKQYGCKKIVTYHSTIEKATIFKELLDKIIGNKMMDMGVFHVNGYQSIRSRTKNMNEFQDSFISVLTNSQALVEGIDIPCIDCVVFADKKESTVQIVQAVGRSLRKYPGKTKAHIIVPILVSKKEADIISSSDFSALLSILTQMCMQDERLLHEITEISEGKDRSYSKNILQSNIAIDSSFKDELMRFNKSIQLRVIRKLRGSWTKELCIEDAKKYKTRKEWGTNSTGAYQRARINGWLEECCKHMKKFWTKERCVEDAKKYKTKNEWRNKSHSAYYTAKKNGWLGECCKHMKKRSASNNKPKGYWTKERCIEDAKKYKTRKEWEEAGSGYNTARNHGWLEECCMHMKILRLPKGYWTKERCVEDAKKCKTRNEWKKKKPSGYSASIKNGCLEECCKHMNNRSASSSNHKPKGYWTKERCIEDAKKYKTRKEWQKKSSSAYGSAFKNGWIDECCKHMKQPSRLYWTKERCIEDAKKCKTRTEWYNKKLSGYYTASKNGWVDECCKHMKKI